MVQEENMAGGSGLGWGVRVQEEMYSRMVFYSVVCSCLGIEHCPVLCPKTDTVQSRVVSQTEMGWQKQKSRCCGMHLGPSMNEMWVHTTQNPPK